MLTLSLLGAALAFAEVPPVGLGANYQDRELSFIEDSFEIALLPEFSDAVEVKEYLEEFDPSGVVELLYTMPLPDVADKDMRLYILQAVSRISTMEGIKYWSGSRQEMYPYLEKNYPVATRRGTRKIDDPVFTELPDEPVELIVFQKDTTFSKAWYNVVYKVTDDAVHLSLINNSVIRYKLFPVMRERRLKIDLIIIPREEDLLFYGSAAYKLGNTFGIDISLDESFDHRMSALQSWFAEQCY